eukprot:scaffold1839_cov382-Prasinococcus_capsulatus_cf.AAC.36
MAPSGRGSAGPGRIDGARRETRSSGGAPEPTAGAGVGDADADDDDDDDDDGDPIAASSAAAAAAAAAAGLATHAGEACRRGCHPSALRGGSARGHAAPPVPSRPPPAAHLLCCSARADWSIRRAPPARAGENSGIAPIASYSSRILRCRRSMQYSRILDVRLPLAAPVSPGLSRAPGGL